MLRLTEMNVGRRMALVGAYFGLAIIGLVVVLVVIGQKTGGTDAEVDSRLMCVSPSTNDIAGDISPGNLKYYSTAKKETDDKGQYAVFLEHALSKLQSQNANTESGYYVTFTVYFNFDKTTTKQLAAAVICVKEFSSSNNACRNRSYFFHSFNKPEALAGIIVDDILHYEPIVRKCRHAN